MDHLVCTANHNDLPSLVLALPDRLTMKFNAPPPHTPGGKWQLGGSCFPSPPLAPCVERRWQLIDVHVGALAAHVVPQPAQQLRPTSSV